MTKILIPKEREAGERRVAATPETVKRLVHEGLELLVEKGAGEAAFFSDHDYAEAGASIGEAKPLWEAAELILKVRPLAYNEALGADETEALRPQSLVVGLLNPHQNLDTVRRLAERGITSLAMELIPRITRAQPMDALSSQASVAGYKAVLLAASHLGKYFPLMMTAAGTVPPARVVIMGAGVAGLQAVGTAKRLGAVVEVSDIRPAVKQEVESLGGKFIEPPMQQSGEGSGGYAKEMDEDFLQRQRRILTERIAAADAVITTAQVPGKKAPLLLTTEMVESMHAGAVVIDLAAEQGGNCQLSRADEEVRHQGILILAPRHLAASVPRDASALYARNLMALLLPMCSEGRVEVNPEDEIVSAVLLTHQGKVLFPPAAELLEGAP